MNGLGGASVWTQLGICGAGLAAGMINAVVGSGTLITFPALLAAGVPPVTANVSNTLGMVAGGFSGVVGYRRELHGQGPLLRRFAVVSVAGGITGAILLLALPAAAFEAAVPVLIAIALVLTVIQPRLAKRLAARRDDDPHRHPHGGRLLLVALFLCGVYGGYFGGAQGVLLLGIMGLLLDRELQQINGIKNVLVVFVNGVASIFFVIEAHIDWWAVLLLAVGSIVGGQLGALVGRRLRPPVLRAVIVLVGIAAVIHEVW